MTGQPNLWEAAREARDAALVSVDENADERWKREAWAFLVRYLHDHQSMFVDDLWDAGLPVPREGRALGALFQRAAREGLMTQTGMFRKSVRSNLSPKPVWRSLIATELAS